MTPVVWLTFTEGERPDDKWDAGMLHLLFGGEMWDPVGARDWWYCKTLDEAKKLAGGAVVVFPGGIHRDRYDELNAALAPLEWVLLIVTADEGSLFEHKHIHHPNLILWVMTPRPGYTYPPGTRFLGEGFHHETPAVLASSNPADRYRDVWFAGQVTHGHRQRMADELGDAVTATAGFAQGERHSVYLDHLAHTRVAPCPAGPVTPDSFRLFEALEAGCVPIADDTSPDYDEPGYWDMVLPGRSWPLITEEGQWADTVEAAVKDWPSNANHASAHWQAHKRQMAYWLVDDLDTLDPAGKAEPTVHRDLITVVVCTSPIPSHPSTAIIEETIESVRAQLPDVEILLGIDGIDPLAAKRWAEEGAEQRHADYAEYTRRLLWLCNHRWSNVLPMVAGRHLHQSGQAREALKHVRTPYVFYVEGDLPIKGDIPFDGFIECLADGTADMIRLTLNTDLEPAHMHLMLDDGVTQTIHGVQLTRTVQWSQQPHLASASYYRSILEHHFGPDEATYIEWRMHSVCAGEWHKNGPLAWFRHRQWIYTPEGDMSRVYHLDGRSGDPVYAL